MPYKDPARKREYMREWIARRRAEWFAGKVCALCGSRENLELDHIDPAQKVSHRIWSWSGERRNQELAKCRPLCRSCHKPKSVTEVEKGEERSQAKLTEADVLAIRASSGTYRSIGERYDVGFGTIGRIKRREDWKHVA
jgi:5-methylcytosine-specific restriction endonuclease McrA